MAVTRVRGSSATSGATAGVSSLASTALAAAPPSTDVVVAIVGTATSTVPPTITPAAAGWTLIDSAANGGVGVSVYWRLGDGATTSWTFNFNDATTRAVVVMEQLTGADTTTPIRSSGKNNGAAVTSLALTAALADARAGGYWLAGFSQSNPATAVSASGMVRQDNGATGSAPNVRSEAWDVAGVNGNAATTTLTSGTAITNLAGLVVSVQPPAAATPSSRTRALLGVGA